MSLTRFTDAQEGVWPTALAELKAGRKETHWMWFVFPQLRGLGRSERARFYGIADLAEARAYLAHPVLGPRLSEAAAAVMAHSGPADRIMGSIDALKLRSSATLFAAAGGGDVFERLLSHFYDGPDPATLSLIETS
ncbi:DUF1810 domain-containing protein [Falsirhodobacter xinxiangensis]|uniref:DUF1810 domain-containing protein n=1 Tax=Falsirhodobacter xinxiangensis TaxID=2530049 RepID=UPI0010AAFCD3|nr:DUF1810 domain-containing protein [Rhodobacter xinxiangensis]